MIRTLEYMIDVMTRAKAGEQVQRCDHNGGGWHNDNDQNWNWSIYDFRIKPREPRVFWMSEHDGIFDNKEDCIGKAIKFVEVPDD